MSSSQSRDGSSHIQSHSHGRMSSQRSSSSSEHPSHGSLPNFGYFVANIDDFDHNDKEFLMEAFGESTLNISDYMNHPAIQPHLLQGTGDRSDGGGKSMSSQSSRTMAPFGVGAENDYLSLNMFAGMPVPFPDGIYAMDPNIRAAGFPAPFLRGLHAGMPGALPIPVMPPSDGPSKETKRGAKKAAPAPPPEAVESNKKPRKNAKKAAPKVEETKASSSSSSSSSFTSSPVMAMGQVGPAPTAAPVFAQGRRGQSKLSGEAMTTKALHALAAKEKRR
jgi:hypothetical protein